MMRKKYLASGVLLLSALGLVGCTDTDNEIEEPQEETVETPSETEDETADESETDSSESTSEVEAQYTTSINQDLIDEHDTIYDELISDFEESEYTFEEPFVAQNPYDRAPLTALVLFETEEPAEITVSVEGQNEHTTISHTYSGFETAHEIPVLGLYPDFDNAVKLSAELEDGSTMETELTMSTDAVPEDLLDFTVEISQPDKMHEGVTFISPSRDAYPAAVDSNGDVRWYSSMMTSHNFKRLENGNNLMVTLEDGHEKYDHLNEEDMLGRVHQSVEIDMDNIYSPSAFHHDTIILPNDNYLTLLHDGSEDYVEDEIVELDRETGEIVHRINLKDVFPNEIYEEYEGNGDDIGDWAHINTVEKLEDEDAILLSVRNQDMTVKLTYPEGEIDWILSYPENHHEEIENYILESIDENLKYPAGQHAVEEMPDQDGNEDTLDIMLFDNNRVFARGDEELNEEYSRAVQYRINQEDHTVEEIWSYGEERGTELYSNIVSDADYLPDSETVLSNFGRAPHEESGGYISVINEVTKTEDPEVVYEIHYGPFAVDDIDAYVQMYRAERLPLYPNN